MKKLCIIGPFPPPVHGLSNVNQFMVDIFQKNGIKTIVLDTKPKSLSRSIFNIANRGIRMIGVLLKYFSKLLLGKIGILYISLSGGWGQIYELIILISSRIYKLPIFIHHHSFAYLNKKRLLTRFIVKLSLKHGIHIVLCEKMGQLLKAYNDNIKIEVLSNAVYIPNQKLSNQINQDSISIGFLSNITFEKGIREFVNVLSNFENYKIKGIIAGPYSNIESKKYLEEHLVKSKNISYVGPVSDKSKDNFFQSIDLLLFPTNYVNEAEPLVIHEAMSYGIPIFSRDRGCIVQILNSNSGMIINKEEDFQKVVSQKINYYAKNITEFNALKKTTINHFNHMKSNSIDSLNNIVNTITKNLK